MNIKSNLQLLAEAAMNDITVNTESSLEVGSAKDAYQNLPVCEGMIATEACDVAVTEINGKYYTEMVNLAPFMLDSGIKSIAKALDMVAEANYLKPKSVGLVVESQSNVNAMLNKAQHSGSLKMRENAINKISRNMYTIDKLISEGYAVAKKPDNAKVCPKCGKMQCKCECDSTSGSGSAPKTVIAECDKK